MPKAGWVSFSITEEAAEMLREVARRHCRTPPKQIEAWIKMETGEMVGGPNDP